MKEIPGSVRNRNASPDSRLFARIAKETDRLAVHGNRVIVKEHIETPYDRYGIVDKKELFQRILGSVSANFYWGGSYEGPHHLMWPRLRYSGDGLGVRRRIPMQFRSSQSLRTIIPRDLHDYLHKITDPPEMPDIDIMEQYCQEHLATLRLYNIVRFHGLSDVPMSHTEKESYRLSRFHEELEHLEEGHIGLLPNKEFLAKMSLQEARQALRGIARIQGLSNDQACKEAFFNEETLSSAA